MCSHSSGDDISCIVSLMCFPLISPDTSTKSLCLRSSPLLCRFSCSSSHFLPDVSFGATAKSVSTKCRNLGHSRIVNSCHCCYLAAAESCLILVIGIAILLAKADCCYYSHCRWSLYVMLPLLLRVLVLLPGVRQPTNCSNSILPKPNTTRHLMPYWVPDVHPTP